MELKEITEGTLDHIAFNVESLDKSLQWYKDTFDITIKHMSETRAVFELFDANIVLVKKGKHPNHVSFKVDDHKLFENCNKHSDGVSYIYLVDIDGNTIELINT